MNWFIDLITKDTVAHTVLAYSLIIAIGVALGRIRIAGVSLGITFVLSTKTNLRQLRAMAAK